MKRSHWNTGIICVLLVGLVFWSIMQNKEINTLENRVNVEKGKNRNYNLHDSCINSMTKTMMIAYNLSSWEAHYYAIIFDDFSKHFCIPWEIYPAIVRIESNFKGNTGSPKGAKGMMQLLEGTGKEQAEEYGIEYVPNQTLWNTEVNLILGCGYLSKNIKEKGLEGGVKCYLGGPDYLKAVRTNKIASQYIGEYKSTVWKEYRQLVCIFKGVVDNSIYNEIHPYQDTISVNPEIFIFTKDTTKGANNVKREKPIRARPAETGGTIDTGDTSGHSQEMEPPGGMLHR